MSPNSQETVGSVTFTEEILNGKVHFLCNGIDTAYELTHQESRCFWWYHYTKIFKTYKNYGKKSDNIEWMATFVWVLTFAKLIRILNFWAMETSQILKHHIIPYFSVTNFQHEDTIWNLVLYFVSCPTKTW